MIAMTLIFLVVFYLVLFVIVGFKAKHWSTRLTGWGILIAPLIWKTWDIPIGYYYFQKLCEAEAGFKVFVPNPAPARIIKLDSYSYTAGHAEEILRSRTSIVAVEAKDKKYNYLSNPVAFSIYERMPDGKITSVLMDKLGKALGKGETKVIESGPSNADYIFTQKLDYPGNRMSRQMEELRSKDGTLIGSSVSLDYMWSNPAKTLFASAFHTSRCGPPMATSDREYNKLLNLIAPVSK